jgi:hypothetical protein
VHPPGFGRTVQQEPAPAIRRGIPDAAENGRCGRGGEYPPPQGQLNRIDGNRPIPPQVVEAVLEGADQCTAVLAHGQISAGNPLACQVNEHDITIYRMESEKDQKELIELLRAERKRRGWKTIKISFYEKEIFIRSNDTEKRGKEKLLRTAKIN